MLKSRQELNEHFEKLIIKYASSPEPMRAIATYCYENFGMPRARTQTILQMDASSMECTEAEIFWIMVAMNEYNSSWSLRISQYYTDVEINTYLKAKAAVDNIQFPLVYDMVEINNDQWIGRISAKELIRLRRADKITYNKSAQRRAKRVISGKTESTKITVIVSVVNKISQLLKERKFISNAITLNIPDDADFYYDKDKKQIVIRDIRSFDIIDGFHRYVAMCNVADDDPDFDYPMEFRLVNFSLEKENTFIWQEEQKTRMAAIDVKSYNMNDLANKIAYRISESATCAMSEIIDRNGIIPVSHLANAIDNIYLKNMAEKEKKTAFVSLPKEIISNFNILTDTDESLLTRKWNVGDIYACIAAFYYTRGKNKGDLYKLCMTAMDELDKASGGVPQKIKKSQKIVQDLLTGEG